MALARALLGAATLLAAGCRGGNARPADKPLSPQPTAAAEASPPQAAFIDSAPSVEPAPGSDSTNPEFDSMKAIARRSGVPDSMIPGELPTSAPAGAPAGIPLVSGLRIVSTLAFPDGDRDNVVVATASDEGVTYAWHLRQQQGGKIREFDLRRFVRANDLAGAPRLNDVVGTEGPDETPGYTFVSLSRATYRKLRGSGEAPFTIAGMDTGPAGGAFGALGAGRVTYKGGFSVVSPTPEPMPVLLDGRRTTLPALHLKGRFAFQDVRQDGDYWILADSAHPLILKEVNGTSVLQVIRIDRPAEAASAVEGELAKDCRAELPGIYFGFASAALDPASTPAIESVAAMLRGHPDWTLAIEGHTDSVGGAAANQALSQQRAEAVRSALVSRFGVPAARLSAAGFGATRPRESNGTIEGRARNRRVEVVRPCGGK